MKKIQLIIIALFLFTWVVYTQESEGISFKQIGKVKPRSSNQIATNNWSIGGETMDRDLVEYNSWKDYIGALGAKQIRLQAGWAKCEKVKGVYDFAWLDEIIDGVLAEGVEPWLQTSYGNPIYEGGGGIHLSAGFPTSTEALEAWDNWIRAMAKRYKGRVKIWEIWNEPGIDIKVNTAELYTDFYIRTSEIIRAAIPDATLYALSLGSVVEQGREYTNTFLKILKAENKLGLVNEITMHGYTYNPSSVYPDYEKMIHVIKKYSDVITIRQGELGCPSEYQTIYALRNYNWTELSQAKWVCRKMMGDLGHDIPSLYFLIIDIVYTHNHEELMESPKRNTKGLIKSDLNRKFVSLKQSYYAYQHVTSIFDHSLKRLQNYQYTVESDSSLSVFAYQSAYFDRQIVAVWMDSQTPADSNKKTLTTFDFPEGNFNEPVFVDLRTGKVYEIPKESIVHKNGTHYKFKNIPIYDSPILIMDKSLVFLEELNK